MSYFRPKPRTLNVNKDTHSAKRRRSQQHHILKDTHLSVVNRGQSNVLSVIKSAPSYSTVFVCVCVLCLCLIDNISSKIVPLEKGVVIYGANALSLLPVVLFVLPFFPFVLIC